ncbi:MAG: AbrB/MazE/SpoVT family DNA-binding domain-containing protein [Hyphomonadaceae bacterium]|nr:MAG: hypothetical protein FD160_1972 [Caulobacteraceae bacterium]MBT9445490.1 AbrB/MazE/SpoVT family DNA-binding domain-containing protein [Hyphomonadaceae bacterium]TPW07034.1 MAG: hypothetical protein FD124_1440 [Alphaproteobacteria bacterium]
MSTSTLTSKGQITLPADVRRSLGLNAGDKVMFIEERDGKWRLLAKNLPASALKGIVPKPEKPVSLEDMEEAIAEGWLRRSRPDRSE